MKKMRIPLLVAWSIAVLGIILGSCFDLHISSMIASSTNTYGLAISAIGPTIGFGGVAVMGGGFIALIVKGKYPIVLKILFGILALCCYGVAVYYPAGEWFGVNGFYGVAPEWVGYLIVILPEAAAVVGGYFLFKDYTNKNIWIVFCIIVVLLLIALLGILPNVKDIVRRPRFRFLANSDLTLFHNWWEPCKNFKELMVKYGLNPELSSDRDHFKSFPSGHTAETTILLVMTTLLPLANKKFEDYQVPAFILSGLLVMLVAFARILAAAHFLSDVSWGAAIVITLLFIANEIISHIKPLQPKEE